MSGSYVSNGQLGSGHFLIVSDSVEIWAGHGPITLTRSDGVSLAGPTQLSRECPVLPYGTYCVSADLVGPGDIASAHLDLIVNDSHNRTDIIATQFLMSGTLTLRHRLGYLTLDADGTTHAFGGIPHLGDAPHTRTRSQSRAPRPAMATGS